MIVSNITGKWRMCVDYGQLNAKIISNEDFSISED